MADGARSAAVDCLDDAVDFVNRLAGAFGQAPHFVGHHCKAAPLLASTCGFNRCVERQQIGLVGDFANHLHDARNLARLTAEVGDDRRQFAGRTGDPVHLDAGLVHHCVALGREVTGTARQLQCFARMRRHQADAHCHLLHCCRHARGRIALLMGGRRNLRGGGRYRAGSAGYFVRIRFQAADDGAQIVLQGRHCGQQAGAVTGVQGDVDRQIATGNPLRNPHGRLRLATQRQQQAAAQPHRGQRGTGHTGQCQQYDDAAPALQLRVRRRCCMGACGALRHRRHRHRRVRPARITPLRQGFTVRAQQQQCRAAIQDKQRRHQRCEHPGAGTYGVQGNHDCRLYDDVKQEGRKGLALQFRQVFAATPAGQAPARAIHRATKWRRPPRAA